jgi:hypothetical protein
MTNPPWKLILTNSSVLPTPAIYCTEWPTVDEKEIEAGHDQPKVKKVHAFLDSHDAPSGANKVNQKPVYAIIGCGFSATIDRATLSKEDLAGLDVVHIGFPDPWSGYVSHDMNQARELLTVPGYMNQPPLADDKLKTTPQKRWLPSNLFQATTAVERERFIGEGKDRLIQAGVVSIETVPEGLPGAGMFKINLTGEHEAVIAERVDILTGTGQQRILKPLAVDGDYGINMTEDLWLEYFQPVKMDDKNDAVPKVVSAEMYVRKTCLPRKGGYVCVTGASPASLQAMEHALCEDGCSSGAVKGGVIVESKAVNNGFLPIGRLDHHAQDSFGNPLPQYRLAAPTGNLFPTREGVWFAESYRINSVEPLINSHLNVFENVTQNDIDNGMLLVSFRKVRSGQRLVNRDKEDGGELVYGKFHQVVLGSGRLRASELRGVAGPNRETGSALDLAWEFKDQLEAIDTGLGFPVGLRYMKHYTVDGQKRKKCLRILGAAGINNPKFAEKQTSLGQSTLEAFQEFLPAQARVNGEGVTLAGHTVAWANKFYEREVVGKRNKNINTATIKELEAIDPANADRIYKARHYRIGPFISQNQTNHALEVFEYQENKELVSPEELAVAREIQKIKQEIKELDDAYHLLESDTWHLQQDYERVTSPAWPTPKEAQIYNNGKKAEKDAISKNRQKLGNMRQQKQKLKEKIDQLQKETGTLTFIHFMNLDEWLFKSGENWGKDGATRNKLTSLYNEVYDPGQWAEANPQVVSQFGFRPSEYLEHDASKIVDGIDRPTIENFETNYYDE